MRKRYPISGFIFGMLLILSIIPASAQQWAELKAPTGRWTQRTLKAVFFVDDGQTGWFAGASGEVLHTKDAHPQATS